MVKELLRLPNPLKEGFEEELTSPLGLNDPDVLPLDVVDPQPVADSSAVGV